jgi:hypothetical protein
MSRDISHRAAFESHGETYTRVLAQQGGEVGAEAIAWLAEKQALRDAASADKRDAREEETLSIAKEANRIASEARTAAFEQARWAKCAAIIAAIAAIIAAAAAIFGK